MKKIQEIAEALRAGEIRKAFDMKAEIDSLDEIARYEIEEIVRQSIIGFLKKGDVESAREAESLFGLPKDSVNDTVKQAVLSSFRDGDLETVAELKNDLPIDSDLGKEIVDYCATWGKEDFTKCLAAVFA